MTPKIFVAIPAYGCVPMGFVKCLTKLVTEPESSIVVNTVDGDSLVSRARNFLTANFLESDCDRMLFVDSDLVFSAEQIARLAAHDEAIVGGFYPKKKDGGLEWVCNALADSPEPDSRELQQLRYIGTGFMMIKREVFERMIEAHGDALRYKADGTGRIEHDFWSVGVHNGRYLSEDWFFCQRALDLGFEVWGDTRVILKHIGTAIYPLQSQIVAMKPAVIPADESSAAA